MLISIESPIIILHKFFSSSVGAASDCVFLAPPMQQGQREGSVSPGTEKRNRSISVIAGLCGITSEIFWLDNSKNKEIQKMITKQFHHPNRSSTMG